MRRGQHTTSPSPRSLQGIGTGGMLASLIKASSLKVSAGDDRHVAQVNLSLMQKVLRYTLGLHKTNIILGKCWGVAEHMSSSSLCMGAHAD